MQVAFCTVGEQYGDANPPGVYLIDPTTGSSSVLFNNFFGTRFNGFDDIQTLRDGCVLNCKEYFMHCSSSAY